MKKKIIIILIITFSCYYLYSFVSEAEKYKLINEIARDDNLEFYKICSESTKIDMLANNLSDFSLFAQLSVNTQKIFQTKNTFKPNILTYLDNKGINLKFSQILDNCESEMHYKISMPIVSPDRQTVLLKIHQDCNCFLGGHSGEYLYKK